jgi:8-oxo-dGTP diphosphatase
MIFEPFIKQLLMVKVDFYPVDFIPEGKLTYSVIAARFRRKWLLVRHNERTTWEIPGGHIEENESADQAAARELIEETGAREFAIECVATYSVNRDGIIGYGRLYFAEVSEFGSLTDTSEIGEVTVADSLPENLTYPDIQPQLLARVIRYIQGSPS